MTIAVSGAHRQKTVVMCCIHYWSSPFQVGSHHVARQFQAAGWRVAYLSAPLTPLHLFRWRRVEDVWARIRLLMGADVDDNPPDLNTLVPGALFAPDNNPLLGSRWVCRNWYRITFPNLRRWLRRHGFSQPDLLYIENPYQAGLMHYISARTTCYHMADDYSAFPGYTAGLREVEADLCRHADMLLLPSKGLEAVARRLGREDHTLLLNGVDFAHFAKSREECARPDLYNQLTGPVVVYAGALDVWFDADLVSAVARRVSDMSFVLIGPDAEIRSRFVDVPNVHLVGAVGRDSLPNYLVHADVGIIPFDVLRYGKLLESVRPLKMFEYLAAGLPVVSRSWPEIEQMKAPIAFADTVDEFSQALRAAVTSPPPKTLLQEYAADQDWKHAFKVLESDIDARLKAVKSAVVTTGKRYVLYDYLQVSGGGERVALVLGREFPEYQLVVSRVYAEAQALLDEFQPRPLVLSRPWSRMLGRILDAIVAFRRGFPEIAHAQSVVYSGYYSPLAVNSQMQGRRIYYCHTPPRFAYDLKDQYLAEMPAMFRGLAGVLIDMFRREYQSAVERMDVVIANSETVRERLRAGLGLEATVVHPPVDTRSFQWVENGDYYLSTARLTKHKRVDVIVRAFLEMPERRLVVASGGPELNALRELAGNAPNIQFLSWQSTSELRRWVGASRAVIYVPFEEDFGISPVEAMAAEKPVIGVNEGGLRETIVDGETGLLIKDKLSTQALVESVLQLERLGPTVMRGACKQRAQQFAEEKFVASMRQFL